MLARKLILFFSIVSISGCKSWGKFWLTEINYSPATLALTQNVTMTPVTPNLPGSPRSCTATPPLPAGLALDATTCTLTGTPTQGQPALDYRISADIGSDTASGNISIRVLFQPRFLYVANTGSANISLFTINAGGSLSGGTTFGTGTNPRFVLVDPFGRFLYAPNHGAATISVFSINATSGALAQISGSPFATSANPYSVAMDPLGRFLYVGHENAGVAAVSAYTVDRTSGSLTQISGSPFAVAAGSTPVSVYVEPQGKFLYVGSSQSGLNAHGFSINQTTGALSQLSGSPFGTIQDAISVFGHPSGKYVYYAQYFAPTGAVGYQRDLTSGALALISGSPFSAGLAPGFITGDVTGRFVYVANSGDTTGLAGVSGFTVDSATGVLSAMPGSPYSSGGNQPIGFAIDETVSYAYAANTPSGTVGAFTVNSSSGVLTPNGTYATGASPFAVTIAGSNP